MRRRLHFPGVPTDAVSIHASVKDATTYRERLDSFNPVSIHASVKDATADHQIYQWLETVSIHASVKDATFLHRKHGGNPPCFNPRICKRCDSMFVKNFIDDTFKL